MLGDEVDGAVSGAEIGGGSEKHASPFEAVRYRYAIDGKVKQVSFLSAKPFFELESTWNIFAPS